VQIEKEWLARFPHMVTSPTRGEGLAIQVPELSSKPGGKRARSPACQKNKAYANRCCRSSSNVNKGLLVCWDYYRTSGTFLRRVYASKNRSLTQKQKKCQNFDSKINRRSYHALSCTRAALVSVSSNWTVAITPYLPRPFHSDVLR
jgi:hypothetical protein